MHRVVILGGGYAGLHAFNALKSKLRRELARNEVEIKLVSRDDYHTYHGWTGEVLAGDLPVHATLTPLAPILGDSFIQGEVISINVGDSSLAVRDGVGDQLLRYSHLIIAAGSTDPFDRIPGLAEHGWGVKNTRDMQWLVRELDARAPETIGDIVVVGGGPAGVEAASALAARFQYHDTRVHIVATGAALLPGMRPDFNHIADRATQTLLRQGVALHFGARASIVGQRHVILQDGSSIASDLTVVTAGVSYATLPGTEFLDRNSAGQILVDKTLRSTAADNVWVAGDIAAARHPGTGEPCPTNALWAMKQGDLVGANVARHLQGKPTKEFGFRGLGQAAGLADRTAITELWGLQFTGRLAWVIRVLFFAWFMPSRTRASKVLSRLWRGAGANRERHSSPPNPVASQPAE